MWKRPRSLVIKAFVERILKNSLFAGIAVCHAPGDYVEEVADFTLSLILNLYRRTYWHAKSFSESRKVCTLCTSYFYDMSLIWIQFFQTIGADQVRENSVGSKKMRGSVLGILGCGRVGTAVGLRAKAFGLHVIFYDPFIKEGLDKALGFERCAEWHNANVLLTMNYSEFGLWTSSWVARIAFLSTVHWGLIQRRSFRPSRWDSPSPECTLSTHPAQVWSTRPTWLPPWKAVMWREPHWMSTIVFDLIPTVWVCSGRVIKRHCFRFL